MSASSVRLSSAVVLTVVAALGLAGCTEDDPATELPCDFWVQQYESGGADLDEVPEECRDQLGEQPQEAPGETDDTGTTEPPDGGGGIMY